jgi:D-alanyl-D-alanine carboxypeptidase (penicillin-binding protein 5/6)
MRTKRWVVAMLAAALLMGCGANRRGTLHRTDPPPVLRPAAAGALQVANGPVATPELGSRPLELRLTATADPVRVHLRRPPRSGLLFDLDTGAVLWRRLPTRLLPIASLTKMMTALVVVEHAGPRVRVPITRQALAYQGSGVGVLPRGKRVSLETLLNGLLLPSGNDAAIALAQRVGGTVRGFVAQMNTRARELGLTCSRFSTPSGIRDAGNRSCAVDLAALARAVLDQPRLARIVRRRRAVFPFPIKGGKLYLYNNNPLLRIGYPGTIGVKTGYTTAAGSCLVAAAQRGRHRLGVVLLHSFNPGRQAQVLLDRGFRVRSTPR